MDRLRHASIHQLLVAGLAAAIMGVGCNGVGQGDSDVAADAGADAPGDASQPDAAAASLSIASPESGAFLAQTEVDVEVRLENPAGLSQVTLQAMNAPAATRQVEEGEASVVFSDVDLSRWNATEAQVILEAVGEQTDGDRVISEPVEVRVDTRKEASEQLREVSEREPVLVWDRDGFPGFIHIDIPAPDAQDPVERGFQVFENRKGLFLIDEPRQVLAPSRVREAPDGRTEVLFEQHLDGMPVAGAALVLSFDEEDRRVTTFSGNYVPRLPEPREARLGRQEADAIAMDEGVGEVGERLFVTGYTRKVVYDPAIFDPDSSSDPSIAWRVTVQGFDTEGGHAGYWTVYVDAHTGQVHQVVDGVQTAIKDLRVKVLNAFDKDASDGASDCMSKFLTKTKAACFENIDLRQDGCNSNADSDGEAAAARSEAIHVHNWFENKFGWTSNEEGGLIKPIVNVDFDKPNAQSNSGLCNNQLLFHDDWMVPDIFYHEFGHRLTKAEGTKFEYEDESGALDEHYSDMFAAIIEGEEEGVGFDPIIGEDMSSSVRDLTDPTGRYREHYSNRYQGEDDHGGVHLNSTIPSKAVWLFTEGGLNDGFAIDALGKDKTLDILWETLRSSHTHSTTDLKGYANAVISITGDHHTSDDVCQVRNAFASVGLASGDSDCDRVPNRVEIDDDDDGVYDANDNCPRAYNPSQKNTDGLGGGDVCDRDDDADGVDDVEDNCPEVANPQQTDRDNNELGDLCEDTDSDFIVGYEDNCPWEWNPSQRDTDGDTVGDECDPDADSDGVANAADNCPLTRNWEQDDQNDNGVGDACEDADDDGILDANDPCPNNYSYDNPDRDGDGKLDACEDDDDDNDGILDGEDNCRFVPNEAQTDSDTDGHGDACDNCPNTVNVEQKNTDGDAKGNRCDADDDGDGVPDVEDNCPQTANARQADANGDGNGDACAEDFEHTPWNYGEIAAAQEIVVGFSGLDSPTNPRFIGNDIPLDVCQAAICRDSGYVPGGFRVSVELEAGFAFRAAIVDGRGRVVRRLDPDQLQPSESAEFTGSMSFEPPAGAFFVTDAVEGGPYQGINYRLRIVGDPAFAGESGQTIDMRVSESVPR